MGYFWPDGPESLPIYVTREGFEAEVISRDGQLTLRGEALHLDVLDIFHKDEVDYLLIRPI